jgi:hypothetical protein
MTPLVRSGSASPALPVEGLGQGVIGLSGTLAATGQSS